MNHKLLREFYLDLLEENIFDITLREKLLKAFINYNLKNISTEMLENELREVAINLLEKENFPKEKEKNLKIKAISNLKFFVPITPFFITTTIYVPKDSLLKGALTPEEAAAGFLAQLRLAELNIRKFFTPLKLVNFLYNYGFLLTGIGGLAYVIFKVLIEKEKIKIDSQFLKNQLLVIIMMLIIINTLLKFYFNHIYLSDDFRKQLLFYVNRLGFAKDYYAYYNKVKDYMTEIVMDTKNNIIGYLLDKLSNNFNQVVFPDVRAGNIKASDILSDYLAYVEQKIKENNKLSETEKKIYLENLKYLKEYSNKEFSNYLYKLANTSIAKTDKSGLEDKKINYYNPANDLKLKPYNKNSET